MNQSQNKRINIVRCALVKEGSLQYNDNINSYATACEVFRKFIGDSDREIFAVIGLDIRNKPTFLNIVSIGQLGEARVNMRELFKPAIISNSASIIIGHNHPAGSMEASPEDLVVTEKIKKTGKMLGITLIDHIIVSNDASLSLRQKNPEYFESK
jgi:DNA repair protein RadC